MTAADTSTGTQRHEHRNIAYSEQARQRSPARRMLGFGALANERSSAGSIAPSAACPVRAPRAPRGTDTTSESRESRWGSRRDRSVALNGGSSCGTQCPTDSTQSRRCERGWWRCLPETERLVREYLPTKSKAYPAEQLGDEVTALREHLANFP